MIEDEERIRGRYIVERPETDDVVRCHDCLYFRPYKDAPQYGSCVSRHTFDGAFRDTDYCSYAQDKYAK